MSIQRTIEQTYAILCPDSSESLDSILDYISESIHLWKDKHTLWDVRALNFIEISAGSLRSFTEKIQPVTKIREGLKTAIIVESDLAFGMIRMFQLLYTEKIKVETEVFMNRDDALEWLKEAI